MGGIGSPIVVGYVETPEGRAALDRAVTEAQQRSAKLVVINSQKGGWSLSPEHAVEVDDDAIAVVRSFFGDHLEVFNGYGATETGVLTFHRSDPAATHGAAGVPVGSPIDGMDLLLVDAAGDEAETGEVGLRRVVCAEDAGVRLHPVIVEGQVHGGLAQGIANALLEHVQYGADGQLRTASLMDYLVPSAAELPSFETLHVGSVGVENALKAASPLASKRW